MSISLFIPSITCAHCKQTHHSVEAVRACSQGAQIFACCWTVERMKLHPEDGLMPVIEDCGADAIATERGFECAAGHSHVTAEFQAREGWAYAEDRDEALALTKAGVQPFTMDGHVFI